MVNIRRIGTGFAIVMLVLACSGTEAFTQSATTSPGLAVGTKAPGFVLKNQANEDVALAQLVAKQNVALVFFRSADW